MRFAILIIALASSAAAARQPPKPKEPNACQLDLDCELNGVCTAGQCKCDSAWSGKNCEILSLKAAPKANGYMEDGVSSWGGTTLLGDDNKYHMFVGTFSGGCGLNSWYRNEELVHAVADTPTGPFKKMDVVAGSATTCPHAVRNPKRSALANTSGGS